MPLSKWLSCPQRAFVSLLLLSLTSGCNRNAPPLKPDAIQRDLTLIEAFTRGLSLDAKEPGILWIVMPPPLSRRPGDEKRITQLTEAAKTLLPEWNVQVKFPLEEDLRIHESSLYMGDFPSDLLSSLLQSSPIPPTALFCFKGIPTGSRDQLEELSKQTYLGGVAVYGEVQVNPLLKNHLLNLAVVEQSGTVTWATSTHPTWQNF